MQKEKEIIALQKEGYGYRRIAAILELPLGKVRWFCEKNPYDPNKKVCLNCGSTITNTPHKREKKFCSDKCRMTWWTSHSELLNRKAVYHLICKHCGKPFDTYGKANQKFCSRTCYAEARRKGENDNG